MSLKISFCSLLLIPLISSMYIMDDDNGEPRCVTQDEINIGLFRNNWDPTYYWQCMELNTPATIKMCPMGTAFLDSIKQCVKWSQWKWERPIPVVFYENNELNVMAAEQVGNKDLTVPQIIEVGLKKTQPVENQEKLNVSELFEGNLASDIEQQSTVTEVPNELSGIIEQQLVNFEELILNNTQNNEQIAELPQDVKTLPIIMDQKPLFFEESEPEKQEESTISEQTEITKESISADNINQSIDLAGEITE